MAFTLGPAIGGFLKEDDELARRDQANRELDMRQRTSDQQKTVFDQQQAEIEKSKAAQKILADSLSRVGSQDSPAPAPTPAGEPVKDTLVMQSAQNPTSKPAVPENLFGQDGGAPTNVTAPQPVTPGAPQASRTLPAEITPQLGLVPDQRIAQIRRSDALLDAAKKMDAAGLAQQAIGTRDAAQSERFKEAVQIGQADPAAGAKHLLGNGTDVQVQALPGGKIAATFTAPGGKPVTRPYDSVTQMLGETAALAGNKEAADYYQKQNSGDLMEQRLSQQLSISDARNAERAHESEMRLAQWLQKNGSGSRSGGGSGDGSGKAGGIMKVGDYVKFVGDDPNAMQVGYPAYQQMRANGVDDSTAVRTSAALASGKADLVYTPDAMTGTFGVSAMDPASRKLVPYLPNTSQAAYENLAVNLAKANKQDVKPEDLKIGDRMLEQKQQWLATFSPEDQAAVGQARAALSSGDPQKVQQAKAALAQAPRYANAIAYQDELAARQKQQAAAVQSPASSSQPFQKNIDAARAANIEPDVVSQVGAGASRVKQWAADQITAMTSERDRQAMIPAKQIIDAWNAGHTLSSANQDSLRGYAKMSPAMKAQIIQLLKPEQAAALGIK